MRDVSSGKLGGWHKFEAARRLAVIGLTATEPRRHPLTDRAFVALARRGLSTVGGMAGPCRDAALDSQRATAPGSRAEVSNTGYSRSFVRARGENVSSPNPRAATRPISRTRSRTGGLTERTEACLVSDLLGGRPS